MPQLRVLQTERKCSHSCAPPMPKHLLRPLAQPLLPHWPFGDASGLLRTSPGRIPQHHDVSNVTKCQLTHEGFFAYQTHHLVLLRNHTDLARPWSGLWIQSYMGHMRSCQCLRLKEGDREGSGSNWVNRGVKLTGPCLYNIVEVFITNFRVNSVKNSGRGPSSIIVATIVTERGAKVTV